MRDEGIEWIEPAILSTRPIDLGGQVKFGPDIVWVERVDHRFDESREAALYRANRRRISGSRRRTRTASRGSSICSASSPPGPTSSLAIADYVYAMLVP